MATIAHDAAGRRTNLTLPNGIVTTYAYNATNRLTEITYAAGVNVVGTLTYEYDQNGNRTKVGGTLASTGLPAALPTTTYNANNQLQLFGTTTLEYDLNGNMTSDGTNTYAWDARGQLESISGSVLVAPQYDALGRRVLNPAGQTLLYDGSNIVQEQYGGSVNINLLGGLGVDEHFLWTDATGDGSYLTDAVNSTVAMMDSSANIVAQYSYDPFGGTTMAGSSSNGLQYTGRENDETGLYYYRSRYYSPRLQRFVSEDPMQFLAGATFYAYVSNSSIDFQDPWGMDKTISDGSVFLIPILGGLSIPVQTPGPNGRFPSDAPRNGNWGGLNWGGGWNPQQHGGQEGSAPPTDSADECYQQHDLCYDKSCASGGKDSCDRELVKCLKKLPDDPNNWPHPPTPGTEPDSATYRWGAIHWFGGVR